MYSFHSRNAIDDSTGEALRAVRRQRRHVWAFVCVSAFFVTTCHGESVFGQQFVPPESSIRSAQENDQTLRELVADLDADEFLRREDVTRKLIDLGGKSIPLLVEALPAFSAEGRSRSFYIIQILASGEDQQVAAEARSAIEALAKDDRRSLSQPAIRALESLDHLRSIRVIAELRDAGATVTHRFVLTQGQYVRVPDFVEIDEDWTGDFSLIQRIKWIQRISRVSLVGAHIDDRTVDAVLLNPDITSLHVREATISDAAFARWENDEEPPRLTGLQINYCPIGDGVVKQIAKASDLELLELYGTGITGDGADRLQELLPQTEIDFRRGGFLGVRCAVGDDRCRVSSMEVNGAAAAAGVRTGDIIVRFGEVDVVDIDQLIELTSRHAPEEEVELTVTRGSETLKLNCILQKSAR